MRLLFRAALIGALAASAVGCSGGHGFLGTDYAPKGDIQLTNPVNNAVITTSVSSPFDVTTGGFTIGISETNYAGPYTVTMASWKNGFNIPCFEPYSTAGSGITEQTTPGPQVNTIQFTAVNANPPGVTTPNPCVFGDGDEESALISDGHGHQFYFYFLLL